jgi:hypothetical protein
MKNVNGDSMVSANVNGRPPIPTAPIRFLEAQAKGDGTGMWNELSTDFQQQLAQQGGSADALTQALHQGPLPDVQQITFVGGSVLAGGDEACIFVVTANVNDTESQVPWYFTVDPTGKIIEFH